MSLSWHGVFFNNFFLNLMEERAISSLKVNLIGLLFFLISTPIILFLYQKSNGIDIDAIYDETIQIVYFIITFFFSIFLHELIHAFAFAIFAKKRWESVKIGILWEHITPYAHCSEPLKIGQYILALVLPGIILGLLPICYAFVHSHFISLMYGLIMLFAAIGDFIVLTMVLRVPKGRRILDHESKVGFWILNTQ